MFNVVSCLRNYPAAQATLSDIRTWDCQAYTVSHPLSILLLLIHHEVLSLYPCCSCVLVQLNYQVSDLELKESDKTSYAPFSSLSSSCKGALSSIALSSEANCLNVGGLVGLATLSSSESIVPPIESWLKGLCNIEATNPCSDATLQSLASNITTACGSDLTSAGISASIVSQIPSLITQYYGVASQAVCTRE